MIKTVIWSFFIFFVIPSIDAQDNPQQNLVQANQFYQDQNYQSALDAYQELLDAGYCSKSLYYNLGNTHFQLGNKGKAVYYLEAASMLAPKDKTIQENLLFVKEQLSDEIIEIDVFPLFVIWENIRQSLSSNTWALLGVLLFWTGIAGFILWLFGTNRNRKKQGFYLALGGLVLCILPFVMAFQSKKELTTAQKAVVMSENVPLKSAPNLDSETLFDLFEGATVQTVEPLQDWYNVRLANGFEGWVKIDQIEVIDL